MTKSWLSSSSRVFLAFALSRWQFTSLGMRATNCSMPRMLYSVFFLKLLGGHDILDLGEISDWIIKQQNPNGHWESYWYPSKFLGTFRAIRALGCSGHFAERALEFLRKSQNEDCGWGHPRSNVLDTAYALKSLGLYQNELPEVEDGLKHLLSAQKKDGSWDGTTVFYYYYPSYPGKRASEEWCDRQRRLVSTSLALNFVSDYFSTQSHSGASHGGECKERFMIRQVNSDGGNI